MLSHFAYYCQKNVKEKKACKTSVETYSISLPVAQFNSQNLLKTKGANPVCRIHRKICNSQKNWYTVTVYTVVLRISTPTISDIKKSRPARFYWFDYKYLNMPFFDNSMRIHLIANFLNFGNNNMFLLTVPLKETKLDVLINATLSVTLVRNVWNVVQRKMQNAFMVAIVMAVLVGAKISASLVTFLITELKKISDGRDMIVLDFI